MAEPNAARIAFVGAGHHATGALYPNIAQIPEFDLVAVCDLVAEKARSAARRFGAPESFSDVETMLDRVAPDGVCVCGPPEMHHAVSIQVLRRGIPLFTEKPPGLTCEQTQELAATAGRTGTWGMVAFMKRFAPANVVAKEYMERDDFGRLSSITLIHGCGPYDDPRRMLLFNGIHMLDLARFFAGDVVEVFAHKAEGVGPTQAVCVSMKFGNGTAGQLNMNSGHSWSDCFEQTYISGTAVGIVIDSSRTTDVMSQGSRFAKGAGFQLFGWGSRYYVSGNMSVWEAGGHYTRGYCGELSHFARAVLGQVEPAATLDDGVAAMRLIDCIMESVESGAPVPL